MAFDDLESSINQKLRGPLHFIIPSTDSSVVNVMITREMLASSGFLLDYIYTSVMKTE